ncbi:MAG: 1-acyl-sn-glycerol-3-phosphate acyltransferase [bacterium]|nr:1-acyl-sn-glycerol-3-phosphate acyltransferase [bacterium]
MSAKTDSDPGFDREQFVLGLAEFLSNWGADSTAALMESLPLGLAEFDDPALAEMARRQLTTGDSWGYHAADPVGRRLSHLALRNSILPASKLLNARVLEVTRGRSVVFLGNHLSFVDGNVLDYLFESAGCGAVSERLTVMVGPKVFALPIRRLASLCFGTIKIPQSTARASGEAVMSAREVAKLARQTLGVVAERQKLGEHLLVFPEGSRSRDGQMQRCLAAVARYIEHEDALVIPFGLWGSERLVPIEEDHVYPAVVRARMGEALDPVALFRAAGGKRNVVGDALGFLIADLLPEAYRGVYSGVTAELERARDVASGVRGG